MKQYVFQNIKSFSHTFVVCSLYEFIIYYNGFTLPFTTYLAVKYDNNPYSVSSIYFIGLNDITLLFYCQLMYLYKQYS